MVRTPFAILAADHGRPLVDMLDALGRDSGPDAQRAFKADLLDTVGRDASGVLIDPDVSLPALRDRVPDGVELLVRIEGDDVDEVDGVRHTLMVPDVGAAGARERGADAAKLMVFLRADRDDGYTTQLVRDVLDDCRRSDLPCVVELMTYRLADESADAFAARREDLIVNGAAICCRSAVPRCSSSSTRAARRAAVRVTDALDVPWAVLSAGVDHDAFRDQLRGSMDGGAAGFIAGRSLWKEAVGLDPGRAPRVPRRRRAAPLRGDD